MKTAITSLVCLLSFLTAAQTPTPFTCSGTDGFGYYISSASVTTTGDNIVAASSRLSKITTSTGARTQLCSAATIGVALNALAFNPKDKFLYAVSRLDANKFSGVMYRLGENCQKVEIPVSGAIIKYANNNGVTIDNGGGNISSGTFDLNDNYYVNTSYVRTGTTGFTNKIQTIKITGNTAAVTNTKTLTCTTCTTKLQITDIIFDETTNRLYGANRQNNSLYSINAATGVITRIGVEGSTGIDQTILGIYKNRFGAVRAIAGNGNIYSVNLTTGNFSFLSTASDFNSANADAASGCYQAASISGILTNDANGLTDNIVNGTGTNNAAGTPLFANLVQTSSSLVKESAAIQANGTFTLVGDFSGTYQVQISSTRGVINSAAPAQNLPVTHRFVGEKAGTGTGSDGVPNGRLSFTVAAGANFQNLRLSIDAAPVANDVAEPEQPNPGGNNKVPGVGLSVSDVEDGTPTTIEFKDFPDPATQGTFYYNNAVIDANNRSFTNFDPANFTVDPVDGPVTVTISYLARDSANVASNFATVTMPFTVAMPVKLTSFTGYADNRNGHVMIAWQTATQYNSEYFLVQRSTNGTDFEDIGRVEADGFSTVLTDYTYPDLNPLSKAYYRLMDVDFDGAFALSQTIFLAYDAPAPVQLYPTVVKQDVTVSYDDAIPQRLTVQFYSMNGTLVLTREVAAGGHTIDLGDLPAGLYGVVISSDSDAEVTRTKIVKQ